MRKCFKSPDATTEFAELTGILLGDGGITGNQVRITVSSKVDEKYSNHIAKLIKKVLGEYPSIRKRLEDHTITLTLSGINLVELLVKSGLVKGNKIAQNVDFPQWIWENDQFQIACVRGLVDTDGGLYFHQHWSDGIKYRNLGLCFSSYSAHMLKSVSDVLKKFDIKHSISQKVKIYIYSLNQIEKYFEIFSTNNPKNIEKLNYHLQNSKILMKKISGRVA